MLEELPVLDMPLDNMRPQFISSHGARIPVQISSNLTTQFSDLMVCTNSNLFVGLLSLYMSLLHSWSGGKKFSIGVAMANRQHEGLENLVGYFANEVAIVADFKDNPSFIVLLSRIRKNVLDAMANSDGKTLDFRFVGQIHTATLSPAFLRAFFSQNSVPFHEVCEALKVTRSSSRTSVFQAMFALQERQWHSVDDLSPTKGEGGLTFNLKQYNHTTSKFEVHLQLRHDGQGGLEGDFHIATDLFTIQTGKRLVEAFKYLMRACVDKPQVQIAR